MTTQEIVREWFKNWEDGKEPQSQGEAAWREAMEKANAEMI